MIPELINNGEKTVVYINMISGADWQSGEMTKAKAKRILDRMQRLIASGASNGKIIGILPDRERVYS
jgi:hypothetical protein